MIRCSATALATAGRSFSRHEPEDRLLQVCGDPASDCDLDPSVIGLADRHTVPFEFPQRGDDFGVCGERMDEPGTRLFTRLEQAARPAKLGLRRLDAVAGLVLLEPHGDQLVREGLRRRAERGLGNEGVCPVEVGKPTACGIGHPQHPPEKLLHVHGASNAGDGAEDVGEGAVPSFLEGPRW